MTNRLIWNHWILELYSIFYNHSTNKSNWGTAPNIKPITNSLLVCAFISNREEATKPLRRIRTAIVNVFWIWRCKLNPIIKTVKELIAIMWRLAFILANKRISANIVLKSAPKRKKCNSGYRSIVMLFFTNKISKKQWSINGILRWDTSASIMESMFPAVRNNKNTKEGRITVTTRTWNKTNSFSWLTKSAPLK